MQLLSQVIISDDFAAIPVRHSLRFVVTSQTSPKLWTSRNKSRQNRTEIAASLRCNLRETNITSKSATKLHKYRLCQQALI